MIQVKTASLLEINYFYLVESNSVTQILQVSSNSSWMVMLNITEQMICTSNAWFDDLQIKSGMSHNILQLNRSKIERLEVTIQRLLELETGDQATNLGVVIDSVVNLQSHIKTAAKSALYHLYHKSWTNVHKIAETLSSFKSKVSNDASGTLISIFYVYVYNSDDDIWQKIIVH